jgi:hypothetical protein
MISVLQNLDSSTELKSQAWKSVPRTILPVMTSQHLAANATAILTIRLAKVRRAETKKIPQRASEVTVLQLEKFFPVQKTALRFHDARIIQSAGLVKRGDDGSR